MGVIDLDARVKKLEQDAGGGAVIDQLEAAVTALEETVNGDGDTNLGLVGDVAALDEQINGDGETDFGLVGDVASLATAIQNCANVTNVSSLLAWNNSLTMDASSTLTAFKIGNAVFLRVMADVTTGAASVGNSTIYLTVDSTIRPANSSYSYSLGQGSVAASVWIDSSGNITTDGGKRAYFELFWFIPTT